MEQNKLSIEAFNELLNKWTGTAIKISKQELADNDETVMELEGVSYVEHSKIRDGYKSKHALQLNGNGEIENENHEMNPLPYASYEIPLADTTDYQFDGGRFTIKNDRAFYTIEQY